MALLNRRGGDDTQNQTYFPQSPGVAGDQGSSGLAQSLIRAYQQALQQQSQQQPSFHMPSFHMPSFHFPSFPQSTGPSAAELMAQQERIQGLNERDELYSGYLTAASTATDFVNNQILQEQANARLLGIDYSITDELKGQRISDYFASIWGEGDQARLEALMSRYGNPEGFTEFTLKRGDGSKYAGVEGSERSVSTSRGNSRRSILTEDEEQTLGASGVPSILGG